MTPSTSPPVPPLPLTAFDRAFDAAVRCGWDGPSAFTAVVVMVAHGLSEREIEESFIDAGRRVQ